MTGHLLGAAGAVNYFFHSFDEIRNCSPTINHVTNDENIDSKLNFTFNKAQKEMNVVMSNTFGFGGHNACVLVKLEI
jgi:3-oxoacyl-[acyl-carrier-protein] synthase II